MAKNIKVRTMAQVRDPNEAGLSVVVREIGRASCRERV